jgi:hypothetical protein
VAPFIVAVALVAIGLILVIYGTVAKNDWGINLTPVSCPCCKAPLPQVRRPNSLRQAMWGGYLCSVCGTEVDKWGRQTSLPG